MRPGSKWVAIFVATAATVIVALTYVEVDVLASFRSGKPFGTGENRRAIQRVSESATADDDDLTPRRSLDRRRPTLPTVSVEPTIARASPPPPPVLPPPVVLRDASFEEEDEKDAEASPSVGSNATRTSHTSTTRANEAKDDAPGAKTKRCAFHLFRHVSKTGGTTLRFLFDRQTVLGDWEYPIPYGASEEEWTALKTAWLDGARAYVNGTRDIPPRTLVEIRGQFPQKWTAEAFESTVLDDVEAFKKEFAGECSVTTSYLVRKPVDQYASYYSYYVEKNQKKEIEDAASGAGMSNQWGRSAEEWAATKRDMQTRELLYERCVHQLREAPFASTHWDEDCVSVSADDWKRVRAMLEKFDVVGTTDRFNEFLHVVGAASGMENLQYVHSNAGATVDKVDMTSLAKALKNVTVYDEKLYAYAGEALTAKIEELFGSTESFRRDVVDPYEARTETVGARRFIGGRSPPAKYKWIKKETAESQSIRPVQLPMWVMPNGGEQAVAYMNFDKVVMVERDNKTASIPCAKGCTFD